MSKPCVRDASENPATPKALGGGIETGSPTPLLFKSEGHAQIINNLVIPEF